MSKSNHSLSLTKDEIEEELVNNDLLNSGGVESDVGLNEMNLKEKQDLLRKLNQSKEEFHTECTSQSNNHSIFDTSTSNFPSLPVIEKKNSEKKLKLPRKELLNIKARECIIEDKLEKSFHVHDVQDNKFNLPFCIDDGALPLPVPEKISTKFTRNPNCVMKGESPSAALKRMLAEHNKWKAAYTAGLEKEEIEESDGEEPTHSPTSILDKEEGEENDPYHFDSKSPVNCPKIYSEPRKRETNISFNETVVPNTRHQRTLQRKASRDSDCEEVEPILKPAETKIGDWIQVQKPKRNKKQSGNQEKARPKSIEENADLQFDFNKTWDEQSGWRTSQSHSSGSLNNQIQARRSLSNVSELKEETVECPICQKKFPQSKVENHAATCEGFSDSPMDVEEN